MQRFNSKECLLFRILGSLSSGQQYDRIIQSEHQSMLDDFMHLQRYPLAKLELEHVHPGGQSRDV
jgi:hypothetical protein